MLYNKKGNNPYNIEKSFFMQSFIKRIDIFGKSVPTFNLKGENTVQTLTGGLFTFFMLCVFFTYGCLKFVHLMERHNPQLSQVTQEDVFNSDDLMNLKDMGFTFAFTVENFLDKEVKADPAYVKYIARFVKMDGGVVSEKILSYHKCNETDWKEFAPAAKGSKGLFEAMRDDPKRGFFCIDWPEDEPVLIYGD